MSMSLGIGIGLAFPKGGGVHPPPGFALLILDGKYLTLDGKYLMLEKP
jgi:hypothetical protein